MITISRYSGVCDVYDTLVDIHQVVDFAKVKIYAYGNDIIPLRIDCIKNLMPYYPYIITMMTGSSNGISIIHLSNQSHVDTEEEEHLTRILDDLKRYWGQCKRKKIPFSIDEALEQTVFSGDIHVYHRELADRVEKLGKKATIDGIHISFYDMMRKTLYEDMIKVGYTESEAFRWCFGWDRWMDKQLGAITWE